MWQQVGDGATRPQGAVSAPAATRGFRIGAAGHDDAYARMAAGVARHSAHTLGARSGAAGIAGATAAAAQPPPPAEDTGSLSATCHLIVQMCS